MKRFVYVPKNLISDSMPAEALRLAAESCLQLRIGEFDDGIDAEEISIISVPEISRCDSRPYAFVGRIFEVDATNEFVDFPPSTVLKVIYADHEQEFSPRIREKHLVRFRPRLTHPGKAEYRIEIDNREVIYSGVVEVK